MLGSFSAKPLIQSYPNYPCWLFWSLEESVCSEPSRNSICVYVFEASSERSEATKSLLFRVLVFWFFFSRDIPSAFVLVGAYFLRAHFSETIQTFQTETQLDALSDHVKSFQKFSTGAILLASKARKFRNFLGFLSILAFFFSQTTANRPDVGTNRREMMFSLIWWNFFYPRIIGLCGIWY